LRISRTEAISVASKATGLTKASDNTIWQPYGLRAAEACILAELVPASLPRGNQRAMAADPGRLTYL